MSQHICPTCESGSPAVCSWTRPDASEDDLKDAHPHLHRDLGNVYTTACCKDAFHDNAVDAMHEAIYRRIRHLENQIEEIEVIVQ